MFLRTRPSTSKQMSLSYCVSSKKRSFVRDCRQNGSPLCDTTLTKNQPRLRSTSELVRSPTAPSMCLLLSVIPWCHELCNHY